MFLHQLFCSVLIFKQTLLREIQQNLSTVRLKIQVL